jgi:hypothetical protein
MQKENSNEMVKGLNALQNRYQPFLTVKIFGAPVSGCLALPISHRRPRSIVQSLCKGSINCFAFDSITSPPEERQQHNRQRNDHHETNPIRFSGVYSLKILDLGRKVSSHQAHR